MSKRRPWIIGLSVVSLFSFCFSYYISIHWKEFSALWTSSCKTTAIAGLFLWLGFLLNSYQTNLFLRKFNTRLRLFELISVTHGMMLGNLIIPMRGGSGALALYLKRSKNLDYHKFAVIYGGTAILVAMVSATMGLVALGYVARVFEIYEFTLLVALVSILGGSVYLAFFLPSFNKKKDSGRVMKFLYRLNESWIILSRDLALMFKVAVSLALINLSQAFALYFIYQSVGKQLSLTSTLVVSSLGAVANLVPITPGSIGFFDAVIVETPRLLGLDTAS
ncbi:MAG: lysylphosphatidylglycerol synthase domain-containing protein, partial [Pseudomonadota bacterium]